MHKKTKQFLINFKEHVLNYPDPDMKMLQRNQEDYFFLATKYYLGDITKIELWTDSIGQNPDWYAFYIRKLQTVPINMFL